METHDTCHLGTILGSTIWAFVLGVPYVFANPHMLKVKL